MRKAIATKEGGIHVEMSPEEEKAVMDQRVLDKKTIGDLREAAALERQKVSDLKQKLKASLGLSDEEVALLSNL